MGWATGSEIAEDLWDKLKPLLTDKKKAKNIFIEVFESYDCDTMEEVNW